MSIKSAKNQSCPVTGVDMTMVLSALERIERLLVEALTPQRSNPSGAEAVLREKLARLTVKRHAVLTATLGGVGYQEIAKLMACDVTTVKLHLKAVLNMLDVQSREVLLISRKDMLSGIQDDEYRSLFGVGKRWWLEQEPALMDVLRTTKPAHNQYSKA